MNKTTELEILIAARDQIKKDYTNSAYIGVRLEDGEYPEAANGEKRLKQLLAKPGAKLTTCAIGGVEHALYSLTGDFVKARVRNKWSRIGTDVTEDTPRPAKEADLAGIEDKTIKLYAKILLRLNLIARREGWDYFEAPNLELQEDESKPIILNFYRKAIKQVRDQQRRKVAA